MVVMEQKTDTRSKIIVKSGWIFIVVNFLLAVFNVVVGVLSNSLAIVSDAIHSLTDAVSGVIIIGSEKLALSRKFAKKREAIERIATILIAIIIILVGVDIAVGAIKDIITPSEVDFSVPTIVVVVASIAAKYLLAIYLKRKGRECHSDVLKASGAETLNDTWISVAVLASVIIYLIWRVNVGAYISLVIAFVIAKVGLEFIFPHMSRHHHHGVDVNPDHDHCGK